jgi:hypothetical protein
MERNDAFALAGTMHATAKAAVAGFAGEGPAFDALADLEAGAEGLLLRAPAACWPDVLVKLGLLADQAGNQLDPERMAALEGIAADIERLAGL